MGHGLEVALHRSSAGAGRGLAARMSRDSLLIFYVCPALMMAIDMLSSDDGTWNRC
jgi:hypothetical protein